MIFIFSRPEKLTSLAVRYYTFYMVNDDLLIENNVKTLLATIPKVNAYGEEITIAAASKTRTIEEMHRALSSGITVFGENKAQEFRDKYPFFKGADYRFFGRLQSNKIKYLIGKCSLIESVDSLRLAEEISKLSKRAGVTTDILIEVNQGEKEKGGVCFQDVFELFSKASSLENIRVKGLMTVMPELSFEIIREKCLQTRNLYDIIKNEFDGVSVLSMGMSHDYEIAVNCGSNCVRLGEAIFGKRDYSKIN